MNPRIRKLLATISFTLAAGVVAQFASACSGCQDDEVSPELLSEIADDKGVKIGMKLDDAERDEAARLLGSVSNGRFPARMVRRDRNAKLFVYLAAKSDKPDTIQAALRAMQKTHTSGRGRKRAGRSVDADYGTVVAHHLGAKNEKVFSAALGAASHAIASSPPDPRVLDQVLKVARSHAVDGARISAINVLTRIPHYRQNPRIASVLLQVLNDKSPAVLSHALYQLYQSGVAELAQKPAFEKATRSLMKHPDPGVRGRAARLIVELAPKSVEVRDLVRAMLEDKHPYPRSIAAHALAALPDVAAIHLLVPKLKDMARNNHHIPYTKLGGKKSAVPHGARNETVHDPCAVAIQSLSKKLGNPWKRASRKHEKAARDQNLASANAWYAKHKGEIPALDAPWPPAEAAPKKGEPDAKKGAPDEKSAAAPSGAQAKAGGKPASQAVPAPAASAK